MSQCRSLLFALGATIALVGEGAAQTSAPNQTGAVQGYHGGYDPVDKGRAPAAPGGDKMDGANPDEGRPAHPVSGQVTLADGRRLTLDTGLVLVIPPTLDVDPSLLREGARIRASYERGGVDNVVTEIARQQ